MKCWFCTPDYRVTSLQHENFRSYIYDCCLEPPPLNNRFYHCQWLPEGSCSHSRQGKMLLMTVGYMFTNLMPDYILFTLVMTSAIICILFACETSNTHFIQLSIVWQVRLFHSSVMSELYQSSSEMPEQSSESFCTFSSGSHCYPGNLLSVGNGVTGCVMCHLTDGLDLVLSV